MAMSLGILDCMPREEMIVKTTTDVFKNPDVLNQFSTVLVAVSKPLQGKAPFLVCVCVSLRRLTCTFVKLSAMERSSRRTLCCLFLGLARVGDSFWYNQYQAICSCSKAQGAWLVHLRGICKTLAVDT